MIAVIFAVAAVAAANDGVDACFSKDLAQAELSACVGGAFTQADRALNVQWGKTRNALKSDSQASALLLESQRAWIKYRDAQCELIADANRGGTMQPTVRTACQTELTQQRTRDLADLIESRLH